MKVVDGIVQPQRLIAVPNNSAVRSVTSIGRRKVDTSHPKLKQVVHANFADCSALAEALSSQDAAIFCLGAYTRAVSDAELRAIIVNYTISDNGYSTALFIELFGNELRIPAMGSRSNATFPTWVHTGSDLTWVVSSLPTCVVSAGHC